MASAQAISGALLGAAARAPALAGVLILLSLLTAVLPRPLPLGRAAEALLAVSVTVIAWIVAILTAPPDATWYSGLLTLPFAGIALSAQLIGITRLTLARPLGGTIATAGLALLAVLAVSTVEVGPLFPLLGAAFLAVQLTALNQADPSRPSPGQMTTRHRRAVLVGGLVAATFATTAGLALPPLFDWTVRELGRSIMGGRTGFSTRMRLGALSGMLASDAEVLRIYGPRPDYLRGVVYTRYSRGRWLVPDRSHVARIASADVSGSSPRVEIWSLGGDQNRFFVPLAAAGLSTPNGAYQVDDLGLVFPIGGEEASVLRYRPAEVSAHQPRPPTAADLSIPEGIRPEIGAIGRDWADGREGLEAIEAFVGRFHAAFTYSLHFERSRTRDPVLDFLDQRRGHCEYFASALALLARASGVPARVVAGYRVTEQNELGGYHLVRERNAHAWVEVWDPERERWVTVEATPPSELALHMYDSTPWVWAAIDVASSIVARVVQWLTTQTPLLFGIGGVLLLVIWLLARWILERRQGPDQRRAEPSYGAPRASVIELLAALERSGLVRRTSEPLERFADRLEDQPLLEPVQASEAAALIRRYAALRFGDEGNPSRLDRDISLWLQGRRQ